MPEELSARILTLDLKRPYVWKLRISKSEFESLESAVNNGTATALQNVVYLAEWYKRCYDGPSSKPVKEFDSQALKQLFLDSGIDPVGNLFQMENGNTSWRYSIYVLGGVAMPFETGHKRFLKELCSIYYGEEGDVDRLGDKERAAAFKESVRTHGSLYEFLSEVLSKHPPFADEDLADSGSQANRFIAQIKSANDEVLKSKFALEWVISFEPDADYMARKLRLILKPESLGGLNHQYLKFERVRLWGISRPENVKRILVGIRFLQGTKAIAEPDFAKPIVEYSATGNAATGFVAWYTERRTKKIDVPLARFDAVEIVARDDAGNEYSVERFKADEWLQVFRVPGGYNEWTSQHCSQRESAVICPADYCIHDDGLPATVYKKKFWVKGSGVSETYQWRSIVDKVRFSDPEFRETTLFNRQGYDQIVAVPHHEILRYRDGLVTYSEEVDGEIEESSLPLVFGRPDIIVRHFETQNDLTEDSSETEYEYEKIEFLHGGQYREWTDDCVPQQGKTTLRITVKGVPRRFVVYFLPKTICRNCKSGEILCDDEVVEKFKLVKDGMPTEPVFHKSFGTDEGFVSLEIWRATNHKELIRQGKVVKYVAEGEAAEISYVLKDALEIQDFSSEGFRFYRCGDICGIYRLKEFSPIDNGNLAALTNQAKVQVVELDVRAPSWLWVNLAKAEENSKKGDLLYWDYRSTVAPKKVADDFCCAGNDIEFQDVTGAVGLCVRSPRLGNYNAFRFRPLKAQVDIVKCFEIATAYNVYYFAMLPLRDHNMDMRKDLYDRLVAKRGGNLTKSDKCGLARLSEEMDFDWQSKYGVVVEG